MQINRLSESSTTDLLTIRDGLKTALDPQLANDTLFIAYASTGPVRGITCIEKLTPAIFQDFLKKHHGQVPPEYLDSFIRAVKNEPDINDFSRDEAPGQEPGAGVKSWYYDTEELIDKLENEYAASSTVVHCLVPHK